MKADREASLRRVVESTAEVQADPGVGPGVKALVSAQTAILVAEKDLTAMVKVLDDHDEMLKLMRSALESLETGAHRMSRIYKRFIAYEVDKIKTTHALHRGDVDPACILCEAYTSGTPQSMDIGDVIRLIVEPKGNDHKAVGGTA